MTRLGWLGPAQPRRLVGSSPAIWAGLGPARKIQILQKKLFQKKSVIFQFFLLYFDQYWFVFLYFKDTNSVLKYMVFVKTLNFFFVFMHTAKSLKNKRKKNHIVFSYNKENFKNMY
jgi:hypothetical protein